MPNTDKVRRAIELRRRKKALNAQLKELNAELDQLDEEIMSSFLDEGIDKISLDGVTLYPMRRVWAGLNGDRDQAVKAIFASPDELGLRATLTSNAQSLSKAVRDRIAAAEQEDPNIAALDGPELIRAAFPMDIAPFLQAWTKFSLGARGVEGSSDIGMPCAIDGCHREHHAMGLCKKHYAQDRRQRRKGKQKEVGL